MFKTIMTFIYTFDIIGLCMMLVIWLEKKRQAHINPDFLKMLESQNRCATALEKYSAKLKSEEFKEMRYWSRVDELKKMRDYIDKELERELISKVQAVWDDHGITWVKEDE